MPRPLHVDDPVIKPGEKVTGYIPAVDVVADAKGNLTPTAPKLIPWQKSVLRGRQEPVPKGQARPINLTEVVDISQDEHVFESFQKDLPAPVRRTARERYEVLVQRLNETARITKVAHGYVRWPASVQRVLDGLGLKADASDQEQVYALAKHYILKAENQQRAKDARKVTTDWHGHFD